MIDKVLSKISLFLVGVLATSVIFAVVIKVINNTFGIALAFIACITIIYFGIQKTKRGQKKRTMLYGMITALVTILVASIILWQIISNSLAEVL